MPFTKNTQIFYEGMKESLHEEKEMIKALNYLAVFPIIAAIKGYQYLEKKGEANPVFGMLAIASLACPPFVAITAPLGLACSAAVLVSSPFYTFYKGYKKVTSEPTDKAESADPSEPTNSSQPIIIS